MGQRRTPVETTPATDMAELERLAIEAARAQGLGEDDDPALDPLDVEDEDLGDQDDGLDDDGEEDAEEGESPYPGSDETDRAEERAAQALRSRYRAPEIERVRDREPRRDRFDRRRPVPVTDTEIDDAMAYAREMRADELRARRERTNRNVRARDRHGRVRPGVQHGPKRPIRAVAMRSFELPDATVVTDSKGNRLHFPGEILRWVREIDHLNRPTQARVAEFRAYGYRVVMDPHTNEPIRGNLGVAMVGSPEGYAARVLKAMPEGALSRDDLMESSYLAADELNRAADGEVVRIVERRQSRRREEVDRRMSNRLAHDDDDD